MHRSKVLLRKLELWHESHREWETWAFEGREKKRISLSASSTAAFANLTVSMDTGTGTAWGRRSEKLLNGLRSEVTKTGKLARHFYIRMSRGTTALSCFTFWDRVLKLGSSGGGCESKEQGGKWILFLTFGEKERIRGYISSRPTPSCFLCIDLRIRYRPQQWEELLVIVWRLSFPGYNFQLGLG